MINELEVWVLALSCEHHTETIGRLKHELKLRLDVLNLQGMVEIVERADLTKVPDDARSLRTWIERAREVLAGA